METNQQEIKMVYQQCGSLGKMFATKPGNLSLIPVAHAAGENQLLKVILYLYTHYYGRKMPMYTYIQINKCNF